MTWWRYLFALLLFASSASAQWHPFFDGAVFATHAGGALGKGSTRFFATNWLVAGVDRQIGRRGTIAFGGKFSVEPFTVNRDGYPQLLQFVSTQRGLMVDRMRRRNLVEELAVEAEWKPIRLYLAPVGEPPLGAVPFGERTSSIDFAEAPFAYDVQEAFHIATKVAAIGVGSNRLMVEGGVFHDASLTEGRTSIENGKVDSWSARLRAMPVPRVSLQASTGKLGDAKQKVTSGSVTWNGDAVAASAIYTRRGTFTSFGVETILRAGRSSFMVRSEKVDRPAGIFSPDKRMTTHTTLGYLLDVVRNGSYRAGIGGNLDYHSAAKSLSRDYGHKPQGFYMFVRVRTNPRGGA